MPEYYTTEDFTKPIECLTMALESIQGLYNEKRIEDRENAEQLIDSYKKRLNCLKNRRKQMNKQEAIDKLKKHRVWFGDATSVSFARAVSVIGQIDEPQKLTVPKFVADLYESIKDDFENKVYDLCVQFDSDNDELSSEVLEWFGWVENEPIQTLVKMKLYGYEIEQEKLYTVRIPNPNRTFFPYTLYRNDDGKIIIIGAGDNYEKREEYHLTESEIKQDFEWAWQFAKEVE